MRLVIHLAALRKARRPKQTELEAAGQIGMFGQAHVDQHVRKTQTGKVASVKPHTRRVRRAAPSVTEHEPVTASTRPVEPYAITIEPEVKAGPAGEASPPHPYWAEREAPTGPQWQGTGDGAWWHTTKIGRVHRDDDLGIYGYPHLEGQRVRKIGWKRATKTAEKALNESFAVRQLPQRYQASLHAAVNALTPSATASDPADVRYPMHAGMVDAGYYDTWAAKYVGLDAAGQGWYWNDWDYKLYAIDPAAAAHVLAHHGALLSGGQVPRKLAVASLTKPNHIALSGDGVIEVPAELPPWPSITIPAVPPVPAPPSSPVEPEAKPKARSKDSPAQRRDRNQRANAAKREAKASARRQADKDRAARRAQPSREPEYTWAKLKDGGWGVRGRTMRAGQRVTITKRTGETTEAVVGRVVARGRGWAVGTLAKARAIVYSMALARRVSQAALEDAGQLGMFGSGKQAEVNAHARRSRSGKVATVQRHRRKTRGRKAPQTPPPPMLRPGDPVQSYELPDYTEVWAVGDYDDAAKDYRVQVINPDTRHKLWTFAGPLGFGPAIDDEEDLPPKPPPIRDPYAGLKHGESVERVAIDHVLKRAQANAQNEWQFKVYLHTQFAADAVSEALRAGGDDQHTRRLVAPHAAGVADEVRDAFRPDTPSSSQDEGDARAWIAEHLPDATIKIERSTYGSPWTASLRAPGGTIAYSGQQRRKKDLWSPLMERLPDIVADRRAQAWIKANPIWWQTHKGMYPSAQDREAGREWLEHERDERYAAELRDYAQQRTTAIEDHISFAKQIRDVMPDDLASVRALQKVLPEGFKATHSDGYLAVKSPPDRNGRTHSYSVTGYDTRRYQPPRPDGGTTAYRDALARAPEQLAAFPARKTPEHLADFLSRGGSYASQYGLPPEPTRPFIEYEDRAKIHDPAVQQRGYELIAGRLARRDGVEPPPADQARAWVHARRKTKRRIMRKAVVDPKRLKAEGRKGQNTDVSDTVGKGDGRPVPKLRSEGDLRELAGAAASYRCPETGKPRRGQVHRVGRVGVTIVDLEDGVPRKVRHGYYAVDAPRRVGGAA